MIVQKRPQSVVGYQNSKRYGSSKLGFHLAIEPVFFVRYDQQLNSNYNFVECFLHVLHYLKSDLGSKF